MTDEVLGQTSLYRLTLLRPTRWLSGERVVPGYTPDSSWPHYLELESEARATTRAELVLTPGRGDWLMLVELLGFARSQSVVLRPTGPLDVPRRDVARGEDLTREQLWHRLMGDRPMPPPSPPDAPGDP
jgi:hypothetical protein